MKNHFDGTVKSALWLHSVMCDCIPCASNKTFLYASLTPKNHEVPSCAVLLIHQENFVSEDKLVAKQSLSAVVHIKMKRRMRRSLCASAADSCDQLHTLLNRPVEDATLKDAEHAAMDMDAGAAGRECLTAL